VHRRYVEIHVTMSQSTLLPPGLRGSVCTASRIGASVRYPVDDLQSKSRQMRHQSSAVVQRIIRVLDKCGYVAVVSNPARHDMLNS
jgi:hypothetical protein